MTTPHFKRFGDPVVLVLTMGFILLFLSASLIHIEWTAQLIADGFAWTAEVLGSFFQLLLLMTFLVGIGVAISPAGSAKVGNLDTPELSTFKWLAIIMSTLLAGGGVFFAAGEPVYHFVVTPPVFDTEAGTAAAVAPALAQSFMHWGFLAWGILGTLSAIVLAHAHYNRGQPLQPRTLLYPVFGERIMRGWFGAVVGAGHANPEPIIRAFWGAAMAAMAAVLLYMGAGQISALQQFIVITAIPVSLVLLPTLYTGPKAAYAMAREQGVVT